MRREQLIEAIEQRRNSRLQVLCAIAGPGRSDRVHAVIYFVMIGTVVGVRPLLAAGNAARAMASRRWRG